MGRDSPGLGTDRLPRPRCPSHSLSLLRPARRALPGVPEHLPAQLDPAREFQRVPLPALRERPDADRDRPRPHVPLLASPRPPRRAGRGRGRLIDQGGPEMTPPPMPRELDVDDVEYIRHGTKPLLARLFRPRATGPFPLMVELHGGAWCRGDRLNDTVINEPLARSGVVVAALDFRMPPEAPYPASLADINYAIRWLKTRATALGSRPDLVGVLGTSSGAHQAMLGGMRPHDRRYAAVPLPAGLPAVDASVRCAVLCWPVIDPLARYHYAKRLRASGPPYPEVVDRVLPCHDRFWQTEEAMAEGSPGQALERGERVALPPVLYIQGTRDQAHPRADLDRFVARYRAAGGEVELELFEGEAEGFVVRNPTSPAATRAAEKIVEFVHKRIW